MISAKHILLASALVAGLGLGGTSQAAVTARMGTSLPDTHPQTLGAKRFAELVEEKTDGEVKVQVFSNGILGNDVNMTSMLQAGTLAFTAPSTATLASLNPHFSIVSLPFQFDDSEHADAVLDGPAGRDLLASLADKGLVGYEFWENGFRHITNSRRAVEAADDVEGLKIRTMQNELYIDMFNGLGANAVPMPVNELFTALETRTVDGQENPYSVIESKRFFEVQQYLSQTAHAYDAQVLIGSASFLDGLTDDQREAIAEAAREATLYQRQASRELNDRLLAELSDKMTVNAVPLEQRRAMGERLAPVIEAHRDALAADFVADFDKALAEAR
ncbi:MULTISPECIES: TRAP transporter substrate-binding protein [Halomonas]|uniref:TRAP transporter substrate-binding protein n=1 Tax=Halomonas TaxID=2745 RepID=UPI001C97E5AC|nr:MULTISPECIES: TRAP transporter substrate-binding protein [Halomonas]MBY6206377.1 TRAP transporter substrate-binding protein [Halomonas sp. DP3Y7-2]MBY6227732.1 TRAP transporter substrate-binding protein [Halomonas sp. DP3Y7-1]MCA0915799.1 TRAP transporter substrate-binding protein [Halomonas denitrificans]